ncbi:MAG: LptF/LptG family permease [Pseudomonadota bacterium]
MILAVYIARQYSLWLFGTIAVLVMLALTFDLVDITRSASGREAIGSADIFRLALAKLSLSFREILPISVLLATLFCLMMLGGRDELIAARASGAGFVRILMPIAVVAILLGFIDMLILDRWMHDARRFYHKLDAQLFDNSVTVSDEQIWLREYYQDTSRIISADRWDSQTGIFENVSFYIVDLDFRFQRRYNASTATLDEAGWHLEQAYSVGLDNEQRSFDKIDLASEMDIENVRNYLRDRSVIAFLQLPSLIRQLEQAGIDASKHQTRYYTLMAQPLLFLAFVVLAAIFTLHSTRRNPQTIAIVVVIPLAIILFLLNKITVAMGEVGQIASFSAALSVPLLFGFLGFGLLLRRERSP